MKVTFLYKNLSKSQEKDFVDYVNQKLPTIKNLLSKFAADACLLNASIEKFEKHDAFQVEFNLSLPTKTLKATEASHHITKAVDLSKDRLVTQIKKHLDLLRNDRSHKTIRKSQSIKSEVQSEIPQV
ncbi:hypothetical protein GF354_04985 [Candidatus Peregrinibacteria bacterium]|nr:hypothetical protein [Candidatus Peregrinibacteria bacterium]